MLYNITMFVLYFPCSLITIFPNIIYPKYVYNNKNLGNIGTILTSYLLSSTFYGLFYGSYYYFGIGVCAEIVFLTLSYVNRIK